MHARWAQQHMLICCSALSLRWFHHACGVLSPWIGVVVRVPLLCMASTALQMLPQCIHTTGHGARARGARAKAGAKYVFVSFFFSMSRRCW
jgi:hypothetical protein